MKKYYVKGAHFIVPEIKKKFDHGAIIDESVLTKKPVSGADSGVDIGRAIREGWIEEFVPHKLTKENIKAHPFHAADMGWKEGDIVHKFAKNFRHDATGEPAIWQKQKGKYAPGVINPRDESDAPIGNKALSQAADKSVDPAE